MKIKVGKLYWTRHRGIVLITSAAVNNLGDFNFRRLYPIRGHGVNPVYGYSAWTADGLAQIGGKGEFDIVEEVTDPVILAFYEK